MSQMVLARCVSCHPTNGVRALRETQNTDPNHWLGLIFSLPATTLLTEHLIRQEPDLQKNLTTNLG